MILHVESSAGLHGEVEPRNFMLGESRIDVLKIIDRWFGEDYSYFKAEASDSATYILRYTPSARQWELALHQASHHVP